MLPPRRPRIGGWKTPRSPQLGWWAGIALWVVGATVLWSDLRRFENPVGEKDVPLFGSGQTDFGYAYLGARAILAGVNPYRNDNPEFTHPIWPPSDFGGFKQIYPPGNLLAHLPLALWKGADTEGAGRIWFRLSLLELLGVSTIVWSLCRRILSVRLTPVWIPFFFVCLAMNAGIAMGIERGQSDILVGFLVWAAIACAVRDRFGLGVFLGAWATSMKGYGLLLTIGLALLGLDRRQWKGVLAGGGTALGIFWFPVRHLMKDAMAALVQRRESFWAVWYNHSFANLIYTLSPAAMEKGRAAAAGFSLVLTLAALIQVKRSDSTRVPAQRAFWLVVFGTAAVATMVGYSKLSVSYNLILVLPGALVLVVCQRFVGVTLALSKIGSHLMGCVLFATAFLLFKFRIGGVGGPGSETGFPSSAFGLGILVLFLAAILIRAWRRNGRT